MKRTPLTHLPPALPEELRSLLEGAALFDSSCSPEARVCFIDRDGGYYLKSASKGSLATEAALTRYFHTKGLATEVVDYLGKVLLDLGCVDDLDLTVAVGISRALLSVVEGDHLGEVLLQCGYIVYRDLAVLVDVAVHNGLGGGSGCCRSNCC